MWHLVSISLRTNRMESQFWGWTSSLPIPENQKNKEPCQHPIWLWNLWCSFFRGVLGTQTLCRIKTTQNIPKPKLQKCPDILEAQTRSDILGHPWNNVFGCFWLVCEQKPPLFFQTTTCEVLPKRGHRNFVEPFTQDTSSMMCWKNKSLYRFSLLSCPLLSQNRTLHAALTTYFMWPSSYGCM